MIIASDGVKDYALSTEMLTRHGLITGATGTGKTTTLRLMTERLSTIGVPFLYLMLKEI